MVKKYAYWRKPDGAPYRRDDEQHAPATLLEEIGRSATVKDDGGVAMPAFSFGHINPYAPIFSRISIVDPDGSELNTDDTSGLISKALDAVIKKQGGGQPIRPSDLLKIVNKEAGDHFRRKIDDYVLITSLSVKELPFSRLCIGDCTISGCRMSRHKFPLPQVLTTPVLDSRLEKRVRNIKYYPIKVATSGRTIHEAVDKALGAVSYLRGCWTLFATFGSSTHRFGSPQRLPIGVIHIGGLHTLHEPNGNPIDSYYWYEPNLPDEYDLFVPKRGWREIERQRKAAFRKISRLPYAEDLISAICRYANAVDHIDRDLAFLHMWSVLEKVTDTVGGAYDKTIRRASWIFEKCQMVEEHLEDLRLRRNLFVHSGRTSSDEQGVGYKIKTIVEHHLVRLIRNDYRVGSLREYGEFLDLPTDAATLKKRRLVLDLAIRARSGGAKG